MNADGSANQFTIKRLFWMLIVASVTFKLADMAGVFAMISNAWNLSQGEVRGMVFTTIIVFGLIVSAYIAWIGIRLPWLIERYQVIRHKRLDRRQRFRDQYENLRRENDSL